MIKPKLTISIITIFPEWFDGPLDDGMLFRAQEKGHAKIPVIDLRKYADDNHHSVDDAPYGGGGGMLFKPEPLARCLDGIAGKPGSTNRARVVFTSPKGKTWNQVMAREWTQELSGEDLPDSTDSSNKSDLVIICGRYEGIDQRIIDSRVDEEISLGDFVMTGGEITALAMIDSMVRLIPGVLGNQESYRNDSHWNGLLEGPHYTRPAEFEGHKIPDVLTSGNHAAIEKWREAQSLEITRERRPDLIEKLQKKKN